MEKLIRYYSSRLLYPELRDYVEMGLGIEARYERCQKFWLKHLELCKEFQGRGISGRSFKSIAILGAGRLLDVNKLDIEESFARIALFDADPTCLPEWNEWGTDLAGSGITFSQELGDLTNSILEWSIRLKHLLKTSKRDLDILHKFLLALRTNTTQLQTQKFEVILSLNLLSQIPLYWTDRVYSLVQRYWGEEGRSLISSDSGIQQALQRNTVSLQYQHLRMLEQNEAKRVILFSDKYFYYYLNSSSAWQVESALAPGIDLKLDGYRITDQNSWLWHIAPQGIEQESYGSIHEVHAKLFERS